MWTWISSVIGAGTVVMLIRRLRDGGRESRLGFVSQQWVAEHRLSHQSETPQA
jgi:hypothetical protein